MQHFASGDNSFIILHEVGSTNNYAMGRLNESPVKEGTAYFARKQTAGKGQRGKNWESTADENIIMSLVLKPRHLRITDQFLLSVAVALGSYDFVKKHTGDSASIKWSNDLYWNDKKAGGILIENVIRGNEWSYAVVGIGINLNQLTFPVELPNPISFRQITGEHYDTISMAQELRECIHLRYNKLDCENPARIMKEYNNALYHKNEEHLYRMENNTFKASICRVERTGKLVLKKGNSELKVDFGEIEFL